MSDIAKRDFEMLVANGSNYITWATDVKNKLDGMKLDHTIVQPEAGKDERTKADKANTLYYLRHHIHPDLKSEYMTEKDPYVL
jgi:ABC-type Zn uptake system ZnuABC Zn-binding protein ZnuA